MYGNLGYQPSNLTLIEQVEESVVIRVPFIPFPNSGNILETGNGITSSF